METTGYNVTITSVLRNSPNTSQVVLYVTADNSSVVSAVDVVEALKVSLGTIVTRKVIVGGMLRYTGVYWCTELYWSTLVY